MQHLPDISFKVIPHKKQRYDTGGDYWESKGISNFRVSKDCAKHEFLILMHELTEWFLIKEKGVPIDKIDAFDMSFEASRKEGDISEPGDDPKAPYYEEHQFATVVERLLADKIGVDWQKYSEHYLNY